jgi:hypothetical protein
MMGKASTFQSTTSPSRLLLHDKATERSFDQPGLGRNIMASIRMANTTDFEISRFRDLQMTEELQYRLSLPGAGLSNDLGHWTDTLSFEALGSCRDDVTEPSVYVSAHGHARTAHSTHLCRPDSLLLFESALLSQKQLAGSTDTKADISKYHMEI